MKIVIDCANGAGFKVGPRLLAALGARRLRYTGLIDSGLASAEGEGRAAMVADLSEGYDGWLQQRRAAGHGDFLRDKRRRLRQLEAKHGKVVFSLEKRAAEVLELVLALKSEQMLRTGQHDVFSAPWTQALLRISPNNLFSEAMLAVLSPTTRTLGPVFLEQLRGAVMGSPLPLSQSLIIVWPQTVGLIAGTIVLFVGGYVVFQRQEVRA